MGRYRMGGPLGYDGVNTVVVTVSWNRMMTEPDDGGFKGRQGGLRAATAD